MRTTKQAKADEKNDECNYANADESLVKVDRHVCSSLLDYLRVKNVAIPDH